MGLFVTGVGKLGGRFSDAEYVLCHGGLGGTYLWFRDVDFVPTHW